MKAETIAIHGGYDVDPTTKAVAVPIYQTAAYAFDSAEHGAALFNLEVEGFRYTRISNPTTNVLERRVAQLEGGVGALSVSSGQAAINYSIVNLVELGSNIVSVPQLYGTTHTLFAHIFPRQGVQVRFAENDHPDAIERLIDDRTKAVFCESVGNPAGNVCDIEQLALVAHKHGVPLIVDNTVATPFLLRPIDYGADVVVHSLTKFLGGHGTTLGGIVIDSGKFPWKEHRVRFPMFNQPDRVLSWDDLYGPLWRRGLYRPCSQRLPANYGVRVITFQRFFVAARHRDAGCENGSTRREWQESSGVSRPRSSRRVGQLLRILGKPLSHSCAEIFGRARLLSCHLWNQGRLCGRDEILQRPAALQAPGEYRRCKVFGVPSGIHHAQADVC